MENRIHYSNCPVCGSDKLQPAFKVKDYTVSGEHFLLVTCGQCSLRFTQDVPGESAISPYYKSEDYISHTNTAKGLVNRLYHQVRRRTLRDKRKIIVKNTGISKGSLLDVGSGTGAFVDEMKQNGWQVTGLEPDADARQVAKQQYQLELQQISDLYQLSGPFDAITLWHVLEHVHELHPYVKRLKSLLAEKGKIFIAVPNYTSRDAVIYQEYWAAYDVPRHLYHFSPASVKSLMEKNGLKVERYLPMWYDSFYISLLSSKYKNGSMNWLTASWNGLLSNINALSDPKQCSSVIYVISHQ